MLVVDSLGPNPLAAHHHQHTNTKSMHLEFFISLPVFLWLTLVKMLLSQMLFLFFLKIYRQNEWKRLPSGPLKVLSFIWLGIFSDESYLNTENVKKNEFVLCEKFSEFTKNKNPRNATKSEKSIWRRSFMHHGNNDLVLHKFMFIFFFCQFFFIHKYVCNLINNVDAVLNRGSNYMHSLMYAAQIHIVIYVLHWLCYEWGN